MIEDGRAALNRSMYIAGAAVALALVTAGCGGGGGSTDDQVVAEAGDIQVTLAEFHAAYTRITPSFRPDISTLEGKRSFADDLINQRIILAEGERVGGIAPEILPTLDQERLNKMSSLLYREEVENKVEVLGSDVKELYDNRQFTIDASHILVETEAEADDLLARINAGELSFEQAATQHSMDQGSRNNGGKLPPILWGRTVPQFQQVAFEMEPGQTSDPIETNFGWHIVRVHARNPNELGNLEDLRPQLRNDVRQQMEQERLKVFLAEIEAKYNVQMSDEAIDVLQDGIEKMTKLDPDTLGAQDQMIPVLTPDEAQMTVATWDGGQITLADYLSHLRSLPPRARPPQKIPTNGLRELVRTTVVQRKLIEMEANSRGLGDRPEVADEDRKLRERVLLETVHGRFLQEVDVTPEIVRAYYDSVATASPDDLLLPERVDMLILTHSETDQVQRALDRIKAGEDEAKVIGEISLEPRTNKLGGRTGLIARGNYSVELEDVAFSGIVGQGWTDPIFTETGIGAVKVLAQEQPRMATFEEVEQSLTQNLAQAHGEQAFDDWLQAERDRRNVQIHDEALELYGQAIS